MSAPELDEYDVDDEVLEAKARRRRARTRVVAAVVALAVIIGLVVSLTGLWQVSAPADDGPPVTELELDLTALPDDGDFSKQQPAWADCGDGFECADVQAPLDWETPNPDDAITLRLVKHPARSGTPKGTLFVNPGGPGASGASYVRDSLDYAVSRTVQEEYDVIGWDPRGVGGSSAVSCLDADGMDDYLFGDADAEQSGGEAERGSDEWIEEAVAAAQEFGEACKENSGDLLAHVDTMSTVRDLEMLREIVGDDELNYLGYSYGTYIGARYADAYPERVGRLVLDGVIDPATTEADVVREQTRGFELALRNYVASCLEADACPLSGTVDTAMAQIGDMLATVDADPLTGSDGRAFTAGTFLTAIITPLYSPDRWAYLNELFAGVAVGDPDLGLALADSYYGRVQGSYADNSTEAFMAINCLDYPNSLDRERMRAEAEVLEEVAPTIGAYQGYGDVTCAGWPETGVSHRGGVTAEGANPILVIGTTGDPATPYRWAESLAEQLESGVLLRYEGEGHTAYGKNACVNDIVDAYLTDDAVPEDGTVCGTASGTASRL